MGSQPILVVDDDASVLLSIGTALELNGYDVLTARNGQDALDLAVERGLSLILLDIGMPGMDGHAFMTEYRQASSEQAPIVVLTGRPGEVRPADGESVAAWLSKPLDLDSVLAAVEQALDAAEVSEPDGTADREAELLAALARDQDPDSLAALYDVYASAAFGMCMRILRDRMWAEEALQDSFINIWRKARWFDRSKASARGWILAVVHNQAIDRLRRERAKALPPPLLFAFHEEAFEPDIWSQVERNLDRDLILRALAALPPAQRLVVQLAYFGGFTQAEVANIVGIPLGTVKGRLRLAMDRLRKSLDLRPD